MIMFIGISVSTGEVIKNNWHVGLSFDGIRAVWDLDTMKRGYIDEEGNVLVSVKYEMACDFVNGIGLLSYKNEYGAEVYGAVNTNGEVVIEFDPEIGKIAYFNGEYGIAIKYFDAETPGRCALIDSNGDLTTRYGYYSLYAKGESSCYGVLFAEKGGLDSMRSGILNSDASIVIPFEYSRIINSEKWNQNILSVQRKVSDDDYRWGYVYSNGIEMLPCIYESAEVFSEGYGLVLSNDKWAIINAYGIFVTDFEFDGINVFSEGLAVALKNGKVGVVNTAGKEVIPFIYEYISEFKDGYAVADLDDANRRIRLENPLKDSRNVNIYLGETWVYTDQEPIIESGRTLVPFRTIAETLGYTVNWNEKTKQVTLQDENRIIYLTIGKNEAIVNQFDDGKSPEKVLLDVSPKIVNGRTVVPLRFVVESTGADIEWDSVGKNIKIKI